jgi:predicted glycosyltransferase
VKSPNIHTRKKIWIDLDNSPHVPLFAPIIQELERRGYSVYLTARDCFQVCELADQFHFKYLRVGRHYGKNLLMKVIGTGIRALQLLSRVRRQKPDLAVSHGSRSQVLSAVIAGIPSLVMADYEFAQPLPGASPTWVMLPEVIPDSAVLFRRAGRLSYCGIKEDIYVPSFKPDPAVAAQLGLDVHRVVVTVRPPADEAHYRNPESDILFAAVMELFRRSPEVTAIILPRNAKQAESIRSRWPDLISDKRLIIPDHAIHGLNLIWYSDLVISGGGTMNREAAALGVPVYSIFRGNIGAVDRYLADSGRLVLLESVEDVHQKIVLRRRERLAAPQPSDSAVLDGIVDAIVSLAESGECTSNPAGSSAQKAGPHSHLGFRK